MSAEQQKYPDLNERWRFRFEFFDRYGPIYSPEGKEAFKKLKFMEKRKVQLNFIALFFGPIYFFVLGLWRKNLSFIGAMLAVSVIIELGGLPDSVSKAIGYAFAFLYAMTANYAYYLHKVKGSKSWNPFEGLF